MKTKFEKTVNEAYDKVLNGEVIEEKKLGKSKQIGYDYDPHTGLLYVHDEATDESVPLTQEDIDDLVKMAKKYKPASREDFN